MKVFKAYIEDGRDVYRIIRPAESLNKFKSMYGGNGDFVKIEDITDTRYLLDMQHLRQVLDRFSDFGEDEKDLIIATLQITNIGE